MSVYGSIVFRGPQAVNSDHNFMVCFSSVCVSVCGCVIRVCIMSLNVREADVSGKTHTQTRTYTHNLTAPLQ